MVTTLYLIRHGETEGGEVRRYKGSIDVPLSERGVRQMSEAASFLERYLRGIAPSIYCSPLSRALRSAEILAGTYGTRPVIIKDLRERHFGVWEGLTFAEIRERYPLEFDAWAGNPLAHSPREGESTLEVRDRVIPALNRLLDTHRGESVMIVAHGGVNRVILCHLIGIPLENIFRIEQECAHLNIIELWDDYPVVKLLNGGPCG